MNPELFEKLGRLKQTEKQMNLREKAKFVSGLVAKLPAEALKTSDGFYTFSDETLFAAGLTASFANTRDEFERMAGLYATGYRSELRKGLFRGRGEIPLKGWQKEIRRLYHLIKAANGR